MQDRLADFQALGAQIVVVSFAPPERLGQYLTSRPWPFPVFADPARLAYRAFGLGSASWRELLRPSVLLAYCKLLLRGWVPRAAREDVHQLGGDFVLDSSGRLLYAHRSSDPADRPTAEELVVAVRRAAGE